ncbi:15746_t:CDS:1, partial [Acaulospora morrowiae]
METDIELLSKAKVSNDIEEIIRLLKKIGGQLWGKVNEESEITLQTADRCLSIYKIYKATNKIAKDDLTAQETSILKEFFLKRVMQSSGEPIKFSSRIDELKKTLGRIQHDQAKDIICQVQEAKNNSEKVCIIKEGYQKLNRSLHKLLYDITELAIVTICGNRINEQEFAVVLLGSWAKGTATPYSDIEFCILIKDHDPKLKETLRRIVYLMNFIVIGMEQTALPWNLFQIPDKINGIDFDDLLKPGFQFDLGGKTPIGRSDKDYDLIQTPQDMANYINSRTLEKDPLLVAELIDCQLLIGNENLYKEYKKKINQQLLFKGDMDQLPFHKWMARVLLQIGTKSLQADLKKYKIHIDRVSDEGRLLNIKAEIYRLPDRLIEGLRLIFATSGETLWGKISGLLQKNIISQAGATQLEFMTAVALQTRLFTYLTHGSQSELQGIWDTTVTPSGMDVGNFFGISDISNLVKFYQIAIPLYQFVQTSVSKEHSLPINERKSFFDEKLTTKATICFRFMLYRQAELLLTEAPQTEDSYFQLFRLYFHLGKPQLAYEFYEKYLECRSLEVIDRFNLGYLKLALGNHKGALDEFNLAVCELEMNEQELSMESVQAYCSIAQIECLLGNSSAEHHNLKKASDIIECLSEKNKSYVMIDFYLGYARLHASQNQFHQSKHYIQQALDHTNKIYDKQAHVKLVDIYQRAAEILQQYNQWEQAVDYKVLSIKMLNTLYVGKVVAQLLDSYISLADTLCLMGKFNQVEEHLSHVTSLLPNVEHELTNRVLTFKLLHGYMKVYQARGSYQWAYDKYVEAISVYETSLKGNPYYRLQLAKFYLDAFETWINFDKREEGKQRLLEAIGIITEQCGESHSDLAKAYCQSAILDMDQGQNEFAEERLLQAYNIYEKLPKIYPNYLTTIMKLLTIFKCEESALLYAEKLYLHAEKLQPSLVLEAIMCFLETSLNLANYQRIIPYIEDVTTKINKLDVTCSISELEKLNYEMLESMLKIKKIKQKLLMVQIMPYLSNDEKTIQTSIILKQRIIKYKGEGDILLKSIMTHRPDLIKLIDRYAELIKEGQQLLDEIRIQLPRDPLEIGLMNVKEPIPKFDARNYLLNMLSKYAIDYVDETELEQLLGLSGQFSMIINMATAYISISKSKSIKEYCDLIINFKGDIQNLSLTLKNEAYINSCAVFLHNRQALMILTEDNNNDLQELLIKNKMVFYLMHIIGDKAPEAFIKHTLIQLGLNEARANQSITILLILNLLGRENNLVTIPSFIEAFLCSEFRDKYLPLVLQAIIVTCYSHLECSSQVNSELEIVMDIYRRALLKFYEFLMRNQHSEIYKNFRDFVIEHLYHLSSICDDSHRSDQKTYLNLLIDLYGNLDKNTIVYAEIITLLSFAERNASNYSRHLELLQEAHLIKSRLYESDSPLLAISLLNLARAFGDIKNNAKQREYSAKGLEILKKDYDSSYDNLTSEEKIRKEVDIVNAMMNFATGHVWFDNSLFVKLLEECLDFYNSHSLNRPDVKEGILSKLINAYVTQDPDKALEIYQQWESLQEHGQEGTQAYAFNVGLVLTNTGMALSKKSIGSVLNMLDSTDISDVTVNNAKILNLQARHIIEKATCLLAAYYPNNHYIFTQASNALTSTRDVENILRSIQKSIE